VETILIFVGMALVTFFTRYAMIAALGRAKPALPFRGGQEGGGLRPGLLQRWLRYVPAAVLAALVVPATLAPRGELDLGFRTLVVLAGTVVAWRTRSVLWTIAAGMTAFWLFRALGW
jgi:branched-subunit amino acid transport protein